MAHITRPLTNNEILKAKTREKDFTLHVVMACSYSSKPLVKNSGASVINDREAAAEPI